MGKAFIWLGTKISYIWSQLQCGWNALMVKLSFDVECCPYKLCKCKDEKKK